MRLQGDSEIATELVSALLFERAVDRTGLVYGFELALRADGLVGAERIPYEFGCRHQSLSVVDGIGRANTSQLLTDRDAARLTSCSHLRHSEHTND